MRSKRNVASDRFNFGILHLFLLGVVAAYIFSFTYLPLQDFPQWIYHGHVFNQIVFHDNDFNGFFSLHPYLPPNASATILIGIFEVFASPILAGKLFLLLCLCMIYLGSWKVLTLLTEQRRIAFAVVAFYGCFSLFMVLGMMNFLFGLGLALLGSAYVIRHGPRVNMAIVGLFAVGCYASHFASFLILCIPILTILLRHWDIRLFIRVCLAFVPSILLLLHYYFTKDLLTFSSSGIIEVSYLENMWHTLSYFPAVVKPFHRIKYVYEPGSFAMMSNYGFAAVLYVAAIIFIVVSIKNRKKTLLTFLGAITLLLMAFSPQYLGGLFYLGERFVFFWWLLLVAFCFSQFRNRRAQISMTLAMSVVAALSFASLWSVTHTYNTIDHSPQQVVEERGGSNPFEHHHFYDDISTNRSVPVFHSGLLNYTGADNTKPFGQKE